MFTQHKITDVSCLDDSSQTRGCFNRLESSGRLQRCQSGTKLDCLPQGDRRPCGAAKETGSVRSLGAVLSNCCSSQSFRVIVYCLHLCVGRPLAMLQVLLPE